MQRAPRWRTTLLAVPLIAAGCVWTVGGDPRVGGDGDPLGWGPDLSEPQLPGVTAVSDIVNAIAGKFPT